MPQKILGERLLVYVQKVSKLYMHLRDVRRKCEWEWEAYKERRLYRQAKKAFANSIAHPIVSSPAELGAYMVSPDGNDPHITLPEEYTTVVEAMAADFEKRIARTTSCIFYMSGDKRADRVREFVYQPGMPESTWDVLEVRDRWVQRIMLRNSRALEGLEAFCSMLLPQIEQQIMGSAVQVQYVHAYRSPVCIAPEASATLWHSDNHHEGIMKIMLYLNDVSEAQAPFEFLRHTETKKPPRVVGSRPPRYPGSRVPKAVIDAYLQNGYERFKATGKKGTILLFDNKIIHKGNHAQVGYRDALVLQLKPAIERPSVYVDPNGGQVDGY